MHINVEHLVAVPKVTTLLSCGHLQFCSNIPEALVVEPAPLYLTPQFP